MADKRKATPVTQAREVYTPKASKWVVEEEEDERDPTYFVQDFGDEIGKVIRTEAREKWVVDEDDDEPLSTDFVQDFQEKVRAPEPAPAAPSAPPPGPKKPPKPMFTKKKQGMVALAYKRKAQNRARFFCPFCGFESGYTRYHVFESVQVAGFPVFNMSKVGDHVECHTCRSTYEPRVLEPAIRSSGLEPLHFFAAKRVMVLMMLADGVIDSDEIEAVCEIYEAIGGQPLGDAAVKTEIAAAAADGRDIVGFLRSVLANLNETGKICVFKGAYQVAAADGEFQEEEQDFMRMLITALDFSYDPFKKLGITPMLAD